jgi:hypothetical protein
MCALTILSQKRIHEKNNTLVNLRESKKINRIKDTALIIKEQQVIYYIVELMR